MKFGQLIEYNLIIIFFKNLKQNVLEKLVPFIKNQNWATSESTIWNVIKFVFIVCPSQFLSTYIKTKVLTTCFYL